MSDVSKIKAPNGAELNIKDNSQGLSNHFHNGSDIFMSSTASGTIAHFEDGADDVPCVSVVANIVPYQEGTGDPSPSNPRPITGFTGLNVTRTGKNLFKFGNLTGSVYVEKDFFIKPATYSISLLAGGDSPTNNRLIFQYEDDSYGGECLFSKGTRDSKTVTLTKPTKKILFYAGETYPASVGYNYSFSDVQIELGSTSTTYAPYQSAEYPVPLGRTVYGGSAEVVGGEGEVTLKGYDLGDLNWQTVGSGDTRFFVTTDTQDEVLNDASDICEIYGRVNVTTTTTVTGFAVTSNGQLRIRDNSYVDATAFTSGVTGKKIVLKLATPTDFTFTPEEVRTFLGANNFFNDCGGDTEVEYYQNDNNIVKTIIALNTDTQSDWNESDSSSAAYIKNKPTIPDISTKMDKANPTGTGSLSINRKSGTTTGSNSVCLAENGTASSMNSTVFGYGTKATGSYSLAEGYNTTASGSKSHAEGQGNNASGTYSHAEGQNTRAYGEASHAEGFTTNAGTSSDSKLYSHAEGCYTYSTGNASHSEGYYTEASGTGAHAEGKGDATLYKTTASGKASHAEGISSIASNDGSHAEGCYTEASGKYTHAEGKGSTYSNRLKAIGECSHAEGFVTITYGSASHAEGCYTITGSETNTNHYSHAEGYYTQATGEASHAEGFGASNMYVVSSGTGSHAEGECTTASGFASHAEGGETVASGSSSHAEGVYTTASGSHSHAEGQSTIASGEDQHVSGRYNVEDTSDTYAEIIGNGTADNDRSNARTLDWSGNEVISGGFQCNAMNVSSSSVTLVNPEKWRDAIFDATPNSSAKDRLLSRLTKGSSNIKVLEYGGYFGGSKQKRLNITFNAASYGKYQVFIHMQNNTTPLDYEIFLSQNSDGSAFEKAAYGKTTPTWTNMVGTVSTGNLTWTANGLQIYSSIFAAYGGWYVKIIAHDGADTDIPNVYFTDVG